MIKVQSLGKKFGDKTAVDDLSFTVEPGKVTGFLGPNGAGKSTTMRLMLGLDLGQGSTTYDGKTLHEYERPSTAVGILLEAKAFHPTRTARNHLRVLADAGGVNPKRVDEVLDIVGMSKEAKGKPGKFSLGMSQRLGIAAAILAKPKYLILDEPANGLDPEGIAWLRQFLRDYSKDGRGVLVSSHLLSEMSLMADNVVVVGRGKLIVNTSMKSLIAKNSRSSVFIRSAKLTQLEDIFKQKKITYKKAAGGFEVTGETTDKVGKLAYSAHAPVLELANRDASLEEVFLELTEGAEEFQTRDDTKKVSKS